MTRPRVVIVGAGFGGLWTARTLANQPVDVTLVDRRNYHTFFPLLYQVAAAELVPTDIAYPVRSIFRRAGNVTVRMADVHDLDLDARRVRAGDDVLDYDVLVLALGSEPSFFGVEGAERHALPLRWMDDAIPLRHHILTRFEAAATQRGEARRRALTFVVVGGGPTGVEYAGALSELIHGPLLRDFPDIAAGEVRVELVEAGPALLSGMPAELGAYARERLERRGVTVRLDAAVARVDANEVRLGDGARIETDTVVWTAGVKGDPRVAQWGLPVGRGGRVPVTEALHVAGRPDVYVVGDLAWLEQEGEPLPQVAQVAIQQGRHAAGNVLRVAEGREPEPFRYKDLGMLAVIGRNSAVAHVYGRAFRGFVAWVLWLAIHIAWLVGFRNRALVLVNWAWNYISFRRAVRLILPTLRAETPEIEPRAPAEALEEEERRAPDGVHGPGGEARRVGRRADPPPEEAG